MQNVVPDPGRVAQSVAARSLAPRREAYEAEARRLIDAAFVVMRRTGDIDPQVRDIVREAGLSNQAFYRHFPSKDALFVAVLADGELQLVEYLRRRLGATGDAREKLRRWIDGVLAQARDRQAAAATRPFTINAARLADQFPAEVAQSRAQLLETLAPTVRALGGDDDDAGLIHDLAMARMHDALAHRRVPDEHEVQHLVDFCLNAIDRNGAGNGT